ncbi:hypothetical protein Tco_0994284 [Tanacetum coccineum]
MDFEPSLPPINLSRSRMSAQPEPFLNRKQVMQELSQYQDFDHHLEAAIQNVQNVQNSLLPSFITTFPQMPPPFHYTTTSTTTIPPFKTSLPPSSTFVPLDQSLRMEGPLFYNHKNTHISFSLMIEMFNMLLFLAYVVYYLNKSLPAKIGKAGFLQVNWFHSFGKPVPFMNGTGWNWFLPYRGSMPLSLLTYLLVAFSIHLESLTIPSKGRTRQGGALELFLLNQLQFRLSSNPLS